MVLVLPGKKKGETENFLSNDTPHSFLAIPVSVTSPKTKLPPGNVNGYAFSGQKVPQENLLRKKAPLNYPFRIV